MPGRHIDATMDGVALPSGIIIREVHEDAPTMEILNGERPGRAGQLMLGRKRQSLKVTLECVITEIFNLRTRAEKAQALAKWADGSVLTLSHHYNQQLNGYLSAVPSLGEVRDYNSPLRVEFTADVIPFWESTSTITRNVNNVKITSVSTSFNAGSVPAPLNVTVKPVSTTLTSFSVTTGGKTIALTGMSVGTLQTLYIDRDERDNLRIRRGTTSYMDRRTPESADDLLITPGDVNISINADQNVNVTFTYKGRWA